MVSWRPASCWPARALSSLLALGLGAPGLALASGGHVAPTCSVAPGAGSTSEPDSALAAALLALGMQNVTVGSAGGRPEATFENRRFRHSADALGSIARLTGGSWVAVERRLGLPVAAIWDTGASTPATIRFVGERDFPRVPAGPFLADSRHGVDLELRPLITYELGRIFDPVLVRLDLEPALRYNPWPGGRVTLAAVIPLRNDFQADALHPDVNRVRPGPLTLEQFAWMRGAVLFSATAGSFADNRYGLSLGMAHPWRQGSWLVDAQADLTGFMAYSGSSSEFSTPSRWTGFCGVTWRPPAFDVAVRTRVARFLSRDRGVEVEVKRSLGNLDVAFFGQRADEFQVTGVRLTLPLPPGLRFPGPPSRVQPAERFTFEYRDVAEPVGRYVAGVASREEFLRQLSRPALAANADRYLASRGVAAPSRPEPRPQRVALTGMTGFVNTPWCGVMADRGMDVGFNTVPRAAAYDHRGEYRNDVYYLTLGFLPRLEAGLRWTVLPGLKSFRDLVPDSRLTDSDRMLSGRVEILTPGPWRPGLSMGVEDVSGTRRFHSTYAVAGLPMSFWGLYNRVAVGYAPRVLAASRHTLDGIFAAFECSPWRPVAAALEYDTEKWNASLSSSPGVGLQTRLALLGGRHASFGVGWFHSL